jgi:hypothetical protein
MKGPQKLAMSDPVNPPPELVEEWIEEGPPDY